MSISDHELLKSLAEDVPDMALSVREHLRIIASRLEAAEQQQEPMARLQIFDEDGDIDAELDLVNGQKALSLPAGEYLLYTHQQPQVQGEPEIVMGSPIQKLGARLADLLDDDQFNNIEPLLLAIAKQPRDAVPDVTTTLTEADHLATVAGNFLSAFNKQAVAEHKCSIAETAENVSERERAAESVNEYQQAIQGAIYEYRKRARRYRDALAAVPAQPGDAQGGEG